MLQLRHLPMAGSLMIFGLLLSSLVAGAIGKLECEELPIEDCAFSVASTGTRCVLEKYYGKDNSIQYECQSSIITAEKPEEWIESDECVRACGLERVTVGLSTDVLLDSHFTQMFCSAECLNNCPNIIDLYVSLAAGEGMYLPHLCKTHRTPRVIADPVKKAMDAQYLRSALLTSSSALAPEGSPSLPTGPDYRGYGGHERTSDDVPPEGAGPDTIAPVSSIPGDEIPVPPLQRTAPGAATATTPTAGAGAATAPTAGGAATATAPTAGAAAAAPAWSPSSKRPFFFVPSPTVAPIVDSVAPPESSSIAEPVPASAPSISSSSAATDVSLPSVAQSFQQMNDDEYLYETYFH